MGKHDCDIKWKELVGEGDYNGQCRPERGECECGKMFERIVVWTEKTTGVWKVDSDLQELKERTDDN